MIPLPILRTLRSLLLIAVVGVALSRAGEAPAPGASPVAVPQATSLSPLNDPGLGVAADSPALVPASAPPAPAAAAAPPSQAAVPASSADVANWSTRSRSLPRLAAAFLDGPALPRPVTAAYRLQAGDVVRVVTWGGVTLNHSVPVDAAGNLGVPGLGMFPVAGKTQGEAQASLVELVRSQFKNGGAVLAVETPYAQAVTVAGEVEKPGYMALPPGGTVLEALRAAGGVLPRGSLRAIRVQAPGAAAASFDLYDLALEGDAAMLTPLPPGSLVFVPLAGPQVLVFGAVRRGAGIELGAGQSLGEAVALAGGLTPDADPDVIRLLREGGTGQELRQVSLAELAAIPAQDGDRLLVGPRSTIPQARRTIEIVGAVRSPGAYAFAPGMTVGQALELAGGPTPTANTASLTIQRQLPEARMLEQHYGVLLPALYDILTDVVDGTVLQPLDRLMIPTHRRLKDSLLVVHAQGALLRPATHPLVPDMTLRDLVLVCEGVSDDAQIEAADLVRTLITADGRRTVERLAVDLRPVLNGEPGMDLRNGDTLVVRKRANDRITVTISGEVRNSGSLQLPAGTTLGQALALSGGLNERGFARGARFYRLSEKATYELYLKELASRLDSAITINERQLAGAPLGMGPAMGGGPDQDRREMQQTIANQQAELARIQRAQATGRMAGVDIEAILRGDKDHDLALQDGDRIEIPARPGTVRIMGEVMTPGSLRYEPGLRSEMVILRCGGFNQQADRRRIYVVRADGSVVATADARGTAWDRDERRWVRTRLERIELEEGDAVIIPPDLAFKPNKLHVVRDISQIIFNLAAATGMVALLAE